MVTPLGAISIGAVPGCLVVMSVYWYARTGVDDPVGALSVHGGCGAWDTIVAALRHEELFTGAADYNLIDTFLEQFLRVAIAFVWTLGTACLLFKIIATLVGLRAGGSGPEHRKTYFQCLP